MPIVDDYSSSARSLRESTRAVEATKPVGCSWPHCTPGCEADERCCSWFETLALEQFDIVKA